MQQSSDSDAVLARKLQQQFDAEAEDSNFQRKNDEKMALALAAGHDISSSEDEVENVVNSTPSTSRGVSLKSSSPKKHSPSPGERSRGVIKNVGERPPCKFGADCRRKNPQHFRDYRHPKRKVGNTEDSGQPPSKKQKVPPESIPCQEVLREAAPYNFLLTKVTGIAEEHNTRSAVNIKDILAVSMGDLVESAQFNYMHDIPWLVRQYPQEHRSKPLLIVHGEDRQAKAALHEEAHPFPHITLCQAKLDMLYGTHHSKMMFLLYTDGMRVVIHTANLIEQDWHQKSQGIWISPLLPKLDESEMSSSDISADSATGFKRDLLMYLASYRSVSLTRWRKHILQHDFRSVKVFLVASVPGRHTGDDRNKWGHLKVRKVLSKHGPPSNSVKNWSVIGQFSSVGSLGADQTKYLCNEWLQSMLSAKGVVNHHSPKNVTTRTLKLIFPSIDNIRTSLEGYKAGASVPYSLQNARKQQYFHTFLHQWKASRRGRSRAVPHIKTYSLLSPDSKEAAWFMVTSANMSKAAWGALEKNGSQLMIRSYEIGVLFLPHHFGAEGEHFSVVEEESSEDCPYFPVPWDVPLVPYSKTDRPWVWDIPYTEKPDTHGNAWIPGGR